MSLDLKLYQIDTLEEPESFGYIKRGRHLTVKARGETRELGIYRDAKPYRCGHCGKTLVIWPCVAEQTEILFGNIY